MKTKNALNVHMKHVHVNKNRIFAITVVQLFNEREPQDSHSKEAFRKIRAVQHLFKVFSDLEVHMRKHTGEKPFVCALCQQKFATKRSLTHHMAFRHENAAKFKCSIGDCTKTFPTAMMLEFHLLKQHTNHTPFICQHCSRDSSGTVIFLGT